VDRAEEDDRSLLTRMLDCHARIREVLSLGSRLAEQASPGEGEVAEVVDRVGRYFHRALPMHVRDEDESILPRLQAAVPAVTAALERMHREHVQHEVLVASLMGTLRQLRDAPGRWGELRGELGLRLVAVEREMLPHLAEEEKEIFPSLSALDAGTERRILEEMQARRDADGGGGQGRRHSN
jgi:iron-sulfur cluster repair protein YtfE (RIC family)